VLRYIHEYLFDDGLTVERVRQTCGIRSNTFGTRFKKNLAGTQWGAVSIRRYIEVVRVEVAKMLLERHDIQITLIAINLGFNSHERFIRSFQRCVGCAPSDYRKRACAHDGGDGAFPDADVTRTEGWGRATGE
jgi:two-component system, response regulator YesN